MDFTYLHQTALTRRNETDLMAESDIEKPVGANFNLRATRINEHSVAAQVTFHDFVPWLLILILDKKELLSNCFANVILIKV